jgi:glutamate/aspartate transport system substrate-binding protein
MDRRLSRTLLAALLLALVPLATTTAQELTGTLKKVKDAGMIVIGYREASLPFSSLPGPSEAGAASAEQCEETAPRGEIEVGRRCAIGYSIDLCREIVDAISEELNWMPIRVRFRQVTPESRIPALKAGEIDLECGSTTNNHQRRREVAFSPPFFITGTRLLVRRADGIRSYRDLKGKTVVVTAGTSNETVIRKLNELQKLDLRIVAMPDHDASFAQFAGKQADAFASDDILLHGFIAQKKADAELTVVGDMLSYDPYGIMYRKDDPDMAQVVERTFTRLAEAGTIVRLYNKWLLEPLPGGERLNRPMTPQLEEAFHSLGWPE